METRKLPVGGAVRVFRLSVAPAEIGSFSRNRLGAEIPSTVVVPFVLSFFAFKTGDSRGVFVLFLLSVCLSV